MGLNLAQGLGVFTRVQKLNEEQVLDDDKNKQRDAYYVIGVARSGL